MAPSTRNSRTSSRKPSPAINPTHRVTKPSAPSKPLQKTSSNAPVRQEACMALDTIQKPAAGGHTLQNPSRTEQWIEPPLAIPVPSWKETSAEQKYNTTEDMEPLGTLPSAKRIAKARVEPFRRFKRGSRKWLEQQAKERAEEEAAEAAAVVEVPTDASARETGIHTEELAEITSGLCNGTPSLSEDARETPAPIKTDAERTNGSGVDTPSNSDSGKVTEISVHEGTPNKDELRISTPSVTDSVRVPVAGVGSSPASSTKSSQTPQLEDTNLAPPKPNGRPTTKEVVDLAADVATQQGHKCTGNALKKLYDDSLTRPDLAIVLEAALSNKQSPMQSAILGEYIKAARRPESGSATSETRQAPIESQQRPELSAPATTSPEPAFRTSRYGRKIFKKRTLEDDTTAPTPSARARQPKKQAQIKVENRSGMNPDELSVSTENKNDESNNVARAGSQSSTSTLSSADSIVDDPALTALVKGPTINANAKSTTEQAHEKMDISSASRARKRSPSPTSIESGPMTKRQKFTALDATQQDSSDALNVRKDNSVAPTAEKTTALAQLDRRSSSAAGSKNHSTAKRLKTTKAGASGATGLAEIPVGPRQINGDARRKARREKAPPEFPDPAVLYPYMKDPPRGSLQNFDHISIGESNIRDTPMPDAPETVQSSTPHHASTASDGTAGTWYGGGQPALSAGEFFATTSNRANTNSRPKTPVIQAPPPTRGKTARVKTSPVKKKIGMIAGIAQDGNGHASPIGPHSVQDDNSDICAACGGEGNLLCCDGCDRSFHFSCVDPPVDSENLPETWHCHMCTAKNVSQPKQPRGLFGNMLENLNQRNPVSYIMPSAIRDYFENVSTGPEGEYRDVHVRKPRVKNGYEEVTDGLKLIDGEKAALCHHCGKSALNRAMMAQCDWCHLYWHLDCTDPPLSRCPNVATKDKAREDWMCPLHTEHLLLGRDPLHAYHGRSDLGSLGYRTTKIRKAKASRVVDTALRRGHVNNGLIEIESESSDDEHGPFVDLNDFGNIYRLPEKGIKLDFIDHVRLKRKEEEEAEAERRREKESVLRDKKHVNAQSCFQNSEASEDDIRQKLRARSIVEQQTVWNLAQLARGDGDVQMSGTRIGDLIDTLTAEAPEEVVAMMSDETAQSKAANITSTKPFHSFEQGPDKPSNMLSHKERAELLKLQELVRRRLEAGSASL